MLNDYVSAERWPIAFNQLRRVTFEAQRRSAGQQIEPFNVSAGFEFIGRIDALCLRKVIEGIVERQSVLRAAFVRENLPDRMAGTVIRQVVRTHAELPWREVDLTGSGSREQAEQLEAIVDEECSTVFELSSPPLARSVFAKVAADRHLLIVVFHHLISDRWSVRVLEREIARGYSGAQDLAPPAYSYGSFARDQVEYLGGEVGEAALQYWQRQWEMLGDAQIEVADLPWARPATDAGPPAVARETSGLDHGVAAEIRRGARSQGVTVYVLALAALGIVLRRLTAKDTVGIWCNFRNRWRPEHELLMGWFVNSHLIGVRSEAGMRGAEVVAGARASLLNGWDQQRAPLGVVWCLSGQSKERGMRVALDIDQTMPRKYRLTESLTFRRTVLPGTRRWFVNLQINVQLSTTGMDLVAVYARHLFPEPAMRSLVGEFRDVLIGLAVAPGQQVL